MTNTEIIQAIKAEIERRLLEKDHGFEDEADYGYHVCLKDMKHFISTLESEKPINMDEELNEEIKKEMVKLPFFIRGKDQIAYARHFAQWGAEHLKK